MPEAVATASPAPAATSPAVTPVAPAPVVAAVPSAAEPTPAASPVQPQPATAPAEAAKAVEAAPAESLIGDGTKPDGPVEPAQPKPAAKPQDAKPTDAPVYDIKLPEGVEVDAPLMDQAKAIFAEGKIAPEIAQKLVTLQAGQMQALGQALLAKQIETWNTTIRSWQKEITEDKVLGGTKWGATKGAIETGLQTAFGVSPTTPANAPERAAHKAFVAALAVTGAGSHPAIIRGLHRIAAPRSEGRPAPVGGPSAPKKSPAQIMYENSKQAAE